MNLIAKSAVAGALALGASSAFALGTPATGTSDIVLVIQNNTTPADVYALDTGISINTLFPSGSFVSGASLNTTALAGLNQVIDASSTLQAFLAANPAASDGWTLEAGQYAGASAVSSPTNQNTKTAGNAKALFTSNQSAINIQGLTLGSVQTYLGGMQLDITSGGLVPLQTSLENDTTVSFSPSDAAKGFIFGASDLGALGTTENIYAFTGNNGTGTPQSYILGTASVDTAGNLTFAQNPGGSPVPLPAAVWLFGSGIMGLLGVSRRRKAAVATA